MSSLLLDIPNLTTGAELERRQRQKETIDWTVDEFAGRVVELRATGASSALSLASGLLLDAQQKNEPAVWLTVREDLFYPPDFQASGIDLNALAIVRMRDPKHIAMAADKLLRCGAFGLLFLDLGKDPWFANALLNRLVRHAEESHTAVVCLTEEQHDARVMGSLVSLRAEATRVRTKDGFRCVARGERDRRRQPGWVYAEVRDGTLGLR